MRAVETLEEYGREKSVGKKDLFALALALEECGSNIVNYAMQRDPQRQFQVTIEHIGNAMTIELRDGGPAFDPTQVQAVEPAADGEDRPPGGWGIQLVRRYMDEIHYRREGDENVLRLTRKLGRKEGQE